MILHHLLHLVEAGMGWDGISLSPCCLGGPLPSFGMWEQWHLLYHSWKCGLCWSFKTKRESQFLYLSSKMPSFKVNLLNNFKWQGGSVPWVCLIDSEMDLHFRILTLLRRTLLLHTENTLFKPLYFFPSSQPYLALVHVSCLRGKEAGNSGKVPKPGHGAQVASLQIVCHSTQNPTSTNAPFEIASSCKPKLGHAHKDP
jgi:hypothetical protein